MATIATRTTTDRTFMLWRWLRKFVAPCAKTPL
jgi:hypothetical protein